MSGAERSYCVYILRCADGTLYTGITTSIERRLAEHSSGKGSKYTRSRLPVDMVYCEERPDRGAALRRELEIKNMSREQKRGLIECEE